MKKKLNLYSQFKKREGLFFKEEEIKKENQFQVKHPKQVSSAMRKT